MIRLLVIRLVPGMLAGILGGLVFAIVLPPKMALSAHLLLSGLIGIIFGLILNPYLTTAGAGLVWGQAFGLLWWLVGSLFLLPVLSGQDLPGLQTNPQQTFPLLLGQVYAFGAIMGLSATFLTKGIYKIWSEQVELMPELTSQRTPQAQPILPLHIQGLIIGGIGGLLGSWLFARGIETAVFFPLVAGIMGSDSMLVGQILHYFIGIIICVTFGALFYRDVRSAGLGLVWGVNYGIFWWVLGPLTLLPMLLSSGHLPDWSITTARTTFAPLIAHILYGALVGLFYALANKLWQTLFIDSDPLNRTREGAGVRGVRGSFIGLVSGTIGGLCFTVVMLGIGFLPTVASLIGAQSVLAGFIVHLTISILVGVTFGLLFQHEVINFGFGLGWGLVYGVLWWILGQLTLFFVILRQSVDWSLTAVAPFYPALIGHLLYGAGLGLTFFYLARRYNPDLSAQAQARNQALSNPLKLAQATITPASALWAVTITLSVIIPLLLAQ